MESVRFQHVAESDSISFASEAALGLDLWKWCLLAALACLFMEMALLRPVAAEAVPLEQRSDMHGKIKACTIRHCLGQKHLTG